MDEQTQIPIDQQQQESSSVIKWLPFSFTWNRAWKLSTILMPLLCVLSLIGLGMGIYAGFTSLQFHPLILASWVLVNIVLWLVVILHVIIDLLVVRHWQNGDWSKVLNGYTGIIVTITAISLFFGSTFLAAPSGYGVSSFCLLISLGTLTFVDIWVLNHMKEKEAK